MENNNQERKVRGQNKLTKETKEELYQVLKNDFKHLEKILYNCTDDERARHLKGFTKYLCNGNDEISSEIRKILWEQLKPHYKRLQFYIPHLTAKERVTVLRGFLSEIAPEHRKEAVDILTQQKPRF